MPLNKETKLNLSILNPFCSICKESNLFFLSCRFVLGYFSARVDRKPFLIHQVNSRWPCKEGMRNKNNRETSQEPHAFCYLHLGKYFRWPLSFFPASWVVLQQLYRRQTIVKICACVCVCVTLRALKPRTDVVSLICPIVTRSKLSQHSRKTLSSVHFASEAEIQFHKETIKSIPAKHISWFTEPQSKVEFKFHREFILYNYKFYLSSSLS